MKPSLIITVDWIIPTGIVSPMMVTTEKPSLIDELGIKDKTTCTGPLYEDDKLAAYVDADVYVLPSRYEIFGNTVLEACACGTPVIVTDRCGVSDFVSEFGYVSSFDKKELKETIIKVLTDPSLPKTIMNN
jgi:glycosyltransferase involved in cell wall biosynthesis